MRLSKRLLHAGAAFVVVAFCGSPTYAQVECNAEMNPIELDAAGVRKNILCLNAAVNALARENTRLKNRVKTLEGLVGELPAPWLNENGVITEEPDRPIGSATFVLSSRSTGGANALPIDQRVLEELCDNSAGCTLTIALKELSLFDRNPQKRVISGPCRFTYTTDPAEKSAWAVGVGCGASEPISGVDGDGGLGEGQANSVEIASAGGGCILADSGLEKSIGQDANLVSDRSEGLFLIAIPARQKIKSRRFECEMSLE